MCWWIYPLIGALGGFLAGLLGIGGGVIFVPVLMIFLNNPIEAIATSLASMTVSTGISTWIHFRENRIDLSTYRKMFPGVLIGSLLGAYLAKDTPQDILRALFGLFSILVALFFILGIRNTTKGATSLTRPIEFFLFGLITATFASFLGIGGGVIALLIFFLMGHSIKSILGITTILSMTITYIAILPLVREVNWGAFAFIAPLSALFAFFGVRASSKIHGHYLEKIFGGFLFITGCILMEPTIRSFF